MDYEKYGQIVEVSSALRRYYGLEASSASDPTVEKWLKDHQFRCVIVILIDAMGSGILDHYLQPQDFFLKHRADTITSVFPPTTAAATTAFLSGRYPKETGWLGWELYFEEVDDNVVLFYDQGRETKISYPGLVQDIIPVSNIVDELNAAYILADNVFPSWSMNHPSEHYHQLLENTLKLSRNDSMRFIYSYWDRLDSHMHRNGPYNAETGRMVRNYSVETQKFAEKLPKDCGLIVIADHSMVEVDSYFIDQDPVMWDLLEHAPSIEPRAASFKIKKGRKEEFERLFSQRLGDDFILLNHDQIFEQNVFGKNEACVQMEDLIEDYLAIAKGRMQIMYGGHRTLHGNHAGGLEEEAMIPLILYPPIDDQK